MVRNSSGLVLFALATLALAPGAGPALAQAQDRATYDADFTSKRPGAPTGLRQEIHYVNPEDRTAKPHAVEEIVVRLPRAARIDTSVPARCNASDAEFQLEGADACPPRTKVGVGFLSVDFGAGAGPVPRIVENDGIFFNSEDELILFTESTNTPGAPIRTANRFDVRRRAFVSRVPPLPGAPPPDPFAAIKDVFNRLEKVTRGRGRSREAYLTTPESCPRSGQWAITATFTYRDGVVQTERSTTPCVGRRSNQPDDRRPPDDSGTPDGPPGDPQPTGPDSEDAGYAGPSRGTADVDDTGTTGEEVTAPDANATVDASAAADGGELPFTGLTVVAFALAGGTLAGAGLALRRLLRSQ